MQPQSTPAEQTRLRYESKTAQLVGRHLRDVWYFDVRSGSPQDNPRVWDYGDWHHAVMGVFMATDEGPVSVTWEATFYPYGVEVHHSPMSEHLVLNEDGPEGWSATHHDLWRGRLNWPIRAAGTYWETITFSDNTSHDVPVAMRLDFDAGPVWVVAAMPDLLDPSDAGKVFVMGDELMVVFTADRMKRIGFPAQHSFVSSPTKEQPT